MTEYFEKAKQDPELRQSFLDGVLFDGLMHLDFDVTYVPRRNPRALMEVQPQWFDDEGVKLFVYENAFTHPVISATQENFFSGLIDHEGVHIRQLTDLVPGTGLLVTGYKAAERTFLRASSQSLLEQMREVGITALQRENEMDAYSYQIRQIQTGQRKATEPCLDHAMARLRYYELLKDIPPWEASLRTGVPLNPE